MDQKRSDESLRSNAKLIEDSGEAVHLQGVSVQEIARFLVRWKLVLVSALIAGSVAGYLLGARSTYFRTQLILPVDQSQPMVMTQTSSILSGIQAGLSDFSLVLPFAKKILWGDKSASEFGAAGDSDEAQILSARVSSYFKGYRAVDDEVLESQVANYLTGPFAGALERLNDSKPFAFYFRPILSGQGYEFVLNLSSRKQAKPVLETLIPKLNEFFASYNAKDLERRKLLVAAKTQDIKSIGLKFSQQFLENLPHLEKEKIGSSVAIMSFDTRLSALERSLKISPVFARNLGLFEASELQRLAPGEDNPIESLRLLDLQSRLARIRDRLDAKTLDSLAEEFSQIQALRNSRQALYAAQRDANIQSFNALETTIHELSKLLDTTTFALPLIEPNIVKTGARFSVPLPEKEVSFKVAWALRGGIIGIVAALLLSLFLQFRGMQRRREPVPEFKTEAELAG